ncbi:hypothetical protein [Paenibacillus sp. L3-i20]|uniref:hypothetical protein n=1 Tax=Paenibacillus sp. L3-i20 TaxID=2905833 RepID=UPI001EDF4376|nr:hypothetical protein [Paenibacillus sp. L3-i20]GKU77578.1 hypothetical protein L3i20_v219750 [Paenibacillus sp. L3-i20]
MLVVSKERYLPVTVNTLVLSANETYFYIHRDVYDQAVILSDRYESLHELAELVGGTGRNDDTVQWFYEQAPKPIHILAPFLSLIDGEIEQDLEICCGVLHVITSLIHARHFVQKPQEVRKSVSFSLTIKEEYEMAWDRFFATALPYEQRNMLYGAPVTVRMSSSPIMEPVVGNFKENVQELSNINHVQASVPIDSTTLLEGFSQIREEAAQESESSLFASTAAERKATKNLLG